MLFGNIRISTKSILPVIVMIVFTLFIAGFGSQTGMWVYIANDNAMQADQKVSETRAALAQLRGVTVFLVVLGGLATLSALLWPLI